MERETTAAIDFYSALLICYIRHNSGEPVSIEYNESSCNINRWPELSELSIVQLWFYSYEWFYCA